ncbi:SAG1386/EF1546 family surface-associated protein [Streptococcus oricebi]|uniref:LysM domain-containing protein n=1 Tax=Streptococcus oricebi TaxID=1547447 RepID=A0ABS5B0X2_9STRE|nr:SAG1386/EF1546 family surface-associated protein [Streptococcus oricebi]MBP2622480.1 hypothetical protein [Streptococcus oricebi]
MAKEPWKEDIYDKGEKELERSKKFNGVWANRVLTILAVIFFIMVITIIVALTYLSTGGSSKKAQTEGFYNANAPAQTTESSSAEPVASSGETTESSEGTLTVQAGEGEAAIAARAGISIAQLEQLNPQHMTQGYWYANPGDVVKIQ